MELAASLPMCVRLGVLSVTDHHALLGGNIALLIARLLAPHVLTGAGEWIAGGARGAG